MDNKDKILLMLCASFLVIVLIFAGATMTGFVSMPVEYRDLCRSDNDCNIGKTCCISYEKEGMGLCMKACQNVQFICETDTDCTTGNVCCKSSSSLGICNPAEKCMDAPILNEPLYQKLQAVEPVLQSPEPLTDQEFKVRYRIAFLIELVIIIILAFVIFELLKKNGKKKK